MSLETPTVDHDSPPSSVLSIITRVTAPVGMAAISLFCCSSCFSAP